MTTIAYRDGILAGDRLGRFGNMRRLARKLHRITDIHGAEFLVGITGDLAEGLAYCGALENDDVGRLAFRNYRGNDDAPDFCCLVVRVDGGGMYTVAENLLNCPVNEEYFAIGSGGPAAMAAMHMGADARKAIEIAALVDANTGEGVETIAK